MNQPSCVPSRSEREPPPLSLRIFWACSEATNSAKAADSFGCLLLAAYAEGFGRLAGIRDPPTLITG
ncbi:hypothetical protein GCM10010412_085590 [Nonomuraea recticatena]|uniref:Uncharacterized protein n=1 Tax=Nonomuraea recticatena TaxID=46178 RepID=A0ABN3T586_9ACTN